MRVKLLLIGVCFCLITCKKDNISNIESDKLIIGNNTNLIINQYDTVLIGEYYYLHYIDIDVNSDKISDFRFISEIWGSAGLGHHPRSVILCLNTNSLLYGILKNDTNYLHRSTSTYTYTLSDTETNKRVEIRNSNNYTCSKLGANDSIISIQTGQFKIGTKRKGAILNKFDLFKSDTCTLIDDWFDYPTFPIIKNDTTVYNYTSVNYTCDSYPSDEICYIGIKIRDSHSEKIGWIKISISDKYKISIMESAIQK